MICLFGGTFDPVHLGHLHGARTVCDFLQLARIRMVLAARPRHRRAPVASVQHRWQMLCLGCGDDPRLVPDDREMRSGATSYTVETLSAVRSDEPDATLLWVLGSDAFAELTSWHRWSDVLRLSNLVVLRRPGSSLKLSGELQRIALERRVDGCPTAPWGQILFLDAPMQDVSSSQIRESLASGRPVDHLLPPRVATYITHHALYGVTRDA